MAIPASESGLEPLIGNLLGRQLRVPRQSAEGIPIGLCEMMSAPVGVVANIGHSRHSPKAARPDEGEELAPHRRQIDQVIGRAQILLCDLELHHHRRVAQSREERAVRLPRLEIDRSVFNLNDDIVGKLTIERHKLIVRLIGAVGAFWVVDESPPHHDALVRFEHSRQHVGPVSMRASEVLRSRFALRISLDEESSEVGNQLIDIVHLVFPPSDDLGIERVGRFESSQPDGRSEIDRQVDPNAIGAEHVGNALRLHEMALRERLRFGIDIVEHRAVDTDRGIGPRIHFHPLRVRIEEDASTGESPLDGAVGIVPMIEDAQCVGRLLGDIEVGTRCTRLLQAQQMISPVEQPRLACRRDDRTLSLRLDGVGVGRQVPLFFQRDRSSLPKSLQLRHGRAFDSFHGSLCHDRIEAQPKPAAIFAKSGTTPPCQEQDTR